MESLNSLARKFARPAALMVALAANDGCSKKDDAETAPPTASETHEYKGRIATQYALYKRSEVDGALQAPQAPTEPPAQAEPTPTPPADSTVPSKTEPTPLPPASTPQKPNTDATQNKDETKPNVSTEGRFFPEYHFVAEIKTARTDLFTKLNFGDEKPETLKALADCMIGESDTQKGLCTDNGQIALCTNVFRNPTADGPLTTFHFEVDSSKSWPYEDYNIPAQDVVKVAKDACEAEKGKSIPPK